MSLLASRRAHGSGTAPLAALVLVVLSYSVVQTMLVPTLGVLQHDLNTSAAGASWAVLSSTLLASAVLTPLISRLGDSRGKREVLLLTLLAHLAGTLGAAFAWNVASLIVFRAVQGASLALLPLAFGLIRDVLPPQRVASGLGVAAGAVAGAAGGGLLLGGLLVDHASWRWLFVVGASVVALALVAVVRYVPSSPPSAREPLDVIGALLLGAALVALLLALTEGPQWGWGGAPVLALFAGSVLLGALFLVRERRVEHPVVDPALLLGRALGPVHLGALLLGVTQFVFYVLVPKLAELPAGLPADAARLVDYGFGASVTVAGLVLLPGTALGVPAGGLTGRLEGRLGPRGPLVLGMGTSAVGGALLAAWHESLWQVTVCYTVIGAGFGLSMAALPRMVHRAAPAGDSATANGINTVARTVGGAVGSQAGAALLASRPVHGTTLPAASGFTLAFWTAAGVSAAGGALMLLGRRRGPGSGRSAPLPSAAESPITR
ncbi:MFS transporter [Streptomyces gamaensis]|uniref:MFS transporter n=1 Tax=Streptomyces gamaensis TaxID=1763542 RepID=A0ABW0Z127_9ACTN